MSNRMIAPMAAVALTASALVGCVSNEPVRGWIPAVRAGEVAAEFDIVDQHGDMRPFRRLLGDYTVVASTRCDRDTHGPATRLLEQIVAENRSVWLLHVVGIDVHWSNSGCKNHSNCHLVSEERGLVSLCDASGAVRRRYGIADTNALYVIGPDGKVVTSASADDAAALRKRLHVDAGRLSEERTEEMEAG